MVASMTRDMAMIEFKTMLVVFLSRAVEHSG